MSDFGCAEDLSEELIEDLRLKGLLSFVVIEHSSNSAITLLVYENEKYRPIVREWGSAVGIHILPPLDRRPFTDDLGNHSISGPLSEIEPIKGFKWLGNWTVTVEKGTDKDGYQYAQGWSKLNSKYTLADHAGRLRFVRRRQWTRVMVVDPDPPAKRLPFELEIRILGTTVKNLTSISQMEAYVDTYFNDVLHSTTFVSQKSASSSTVATGSTSSVIGASGATATTCTTTVIRPLYSLDPHLKISFVVHKNRLSSATSSSTGRVDMLLNHFLDDKNKGFVEHEYQLPNTSNRYLQLAIEVREQQLFTIDKVNPKLLALHNHNHSPVGNGPANAESLEVVLSPRLKDKIIILSLAIESDCNGLLDEIVGFLTEAMHYVTELDLFDIIDDINQMYKKSEFSKLITLLQDSDHPLKSVMRYPAIHAEWCVYTKVMALPQPSESDSSANNSTQSPHTLLRRNSSVRAINPAPPTMSFTKRHEEVSTSNERFLKYQPCLSRDHSPGFLKATLDAPEMANITPGLRGYRLTICCADNVYYEMVWTNFYEYIQIQKVFSILKYQPEEVNEHLDCMFQVVYYPSKYSNEAPEALKANLHLNAENSCFQLSIPRNISALTGGTSGTNSNNNSMYNMDVAAATERPTSAANNLITIGFDEIEYIEVGCSHHISAKYILEVKLLSLQAQLLRYMMQNKTYLELDTADGQHFRVDLNGSRTESFRLNSSSSFPLNDTLRLLVPGSLLADPTANIDEFLYMTINTDGAWDEQHATDITQRSQALQNDPETYYPTQSITAGSFRAESKSKSMFSSKKSTALFASTSSSKADSNDRDRDDPPRPVNRTVIKLCNRVAIPLSGLINKISTEQESQVTLFKLNCKWSLKVFRIEGLPQKKSSDQALTYFTAYLADSNGEPILHIEKERDDPTRSPSRVSRLSKATSGGISGSSSPSSGSSGAASMGWVHRSAAVNSTHMAAFAEAEVIDISSEKHGDSLNNAKYVLVQFWSRALPSGGSSGGGSSNSGGDTAVGEILIPLLSAHKVTDDVELNVWSPDSPSKHRVLLPSVLSSKKTSQTVNTGAVASVQLNMCNHQNFDYEASDRSSVKLVTSLKPIQSADCSWPCRFLNKQLQGVEAEVFYFFPAHDGLHIFCKPYSQSGDLKRHPNSVGSVLSECLERKAITTGENRLQLVVPYSQVSTSDMHIITDNMLALSVALKRCIKVAGSNLNSIQKEIKLELLVGPCLAKDLYTIMHNRISLFSIRSTLSSYATDKRKEEQEVFDNVAKMLQDEILNTMEGIDQFVRKPGSSVVGTSITCRGSSTVTPLATTPTNATHDHSHLFPLKLLYLKKAALKIYLWFLIEQTKLTFTSKTAYLESSWLIFDEFNTDAEDLNSIYDDTDALMQRVGLIMENLDRDVRCMVFQAHKTAKKDISQRLTAVVYDKFLVVINYLMKSINLERSVSGVVGNEKIYTSADPQKKRDLIKFIITHDNMFEVALNSTLRPHDYQFSLSPLLSTCIDFELLIEKFAALVNENILLWNARTFEHFRVHKDNSSLLTNQDFAPWAVTSMIEDTTNHELYISNIPETIQTQLNVEIGLKKVPITDTHMGQISLQRVVLLNQKISAAIAKVYLALASEYEKVLVNGIQSLSLRDKNAKLKNGRPVTEQDKDDMICFLMSLINDCHRMYTKHIPDSMSNFLEEEENEESRDDGAGAGLGGIMDQSCMLFLVSSRAMEAVSQNSINQLSNQIFFMSELRVYFLLAFDAHVVSAPPSRWTKKRDSMYGAAATAAAAEHSPVDVICATLKDFFQFTSLHLNDDDIEKLLYVCTKKVVLRYLLFLRDLLVMLPAAKAAREKEAALREKEAAQREKESKLDKHSDVLHRKSLGGANLLPPGSPQSPAKTRRNRRSSEGDASTIGRHLDREKGLDKGLDRKLSHLTLDQAALKDAKRMMGEKSPVKPTRVMAADSSDDENLATDGDDDDEPESESSSVKHARDASLSTASSGNGDSQSAATAQPADKYGPAVEGSPLQREEIYKIKTDLKSIIRLHSHIKLGIQAAQSASQAGSDAAHASSSEAEKDREGTEYQTFFNNSAANLFMIVQDVANRLIYGEISETSSVDDVIHSFFAITPPQWNPDRVVYERNLAAFLELNSNFIQQNENGDASRQSQHSYTIQISNLSCVKQNKHKNCFIRVLVDNQVRETAVRSSSMIQHATSWDGTLTFNNIQGYENKVVELQLVGYRLRALQQWRERLIGSVKINLSVLAQSSPYIADVAPTPSAGSSRGKSFAARMSMSESAHFRETTSGNSLHDAGNLGNSVILANHCAWFVVDKKNASSDPSSSSTSATVGAADKGKGGAKGANSAGSVVGLLSSETVRMDLDETQLRVGIKMIRNGL